MILSWTGKRGIWLRQGVAPDASYSVLLWGRISAGRPVWEPRLERNVQNRRAPKSPVTAGCRAPVVEVRDGKLCTLAWAGLWKRGIDSIYAELHQIKDEDALLQECFGPQVNQVARDVFLTTAPARAAEVVEWSRLVAVGFDPCARGHEWMWSSEIQTTAPGQQGRSCARCDYHEKVRVCDDGRACAECTVEDCRCVHHALQEAERQGFKYRGQVWAPGGAVWGQQFGTKP